MWLCGPAVLAVHVLGSQLLGVQVLGIAVPGSSVLGVQVLGIAVPGSSVPGVQVLDPVAMLLDVPIGWLLAWLESVVPMATVGIGGAIGAAMRYVLFSRFPTRRFPWTTLFVNVLGSFIAAVAVFAGASESTLQLVSIGICGAFTTFSTFSVETVQLVEDGTPWLALVNAVTNLGGSLVGIGLAWLLVMGLS